MYDVCIIGAGVVGCAIARALSAYTLRVVVVERADDVSQGASKANSGIVHGGYASPPNTVKSELCVKGNRMFRELERELHFGYREIGALVLGFSAADLEVLERLRADGRANGVEDLEILGPREIASTEAMVSAEASAALFCGSVGVTSPYELTIALAENAVSNGVELRLRAAVVGIEKGSCFTVVTTGGRIEAQFVVNAAGVESDTVAAMVGEPGFSIRPRKGEYLLFERGYGSILGKVIFQAPTARTKGVLVTPTYHGNLLVGPNAEEVHSRENVDTEPATLLELARTARRSVPNLDLSKVITTFSGLRAACDRRDFIIEEAKTRGFLNVAGIESPGLTAAPAIAERVAALLKELGLSLTARQARRGTRSPIIVPKRLAEEEVKRLVAMESALERIVCRCELVTEGEILDSMRRGIPVETVDAVKRRTRAGMGQCQGAFCRPRVKALLARELGVPVEDVRVRADAAPRRAARGFSKMAPEPPSSHSPD